MNSAPFIFFAILLGLVGSWWSVIVAPSLQFGGASAVFAKDTGQYYPTVRPGDALQGAEVYRAQGCNVCHSQMVRPEGFGYDLALGWGKRRTIGEDYLRDDPVMLGSVRVGPDLSNIGTRMGAGDSNAQPAMVAYHLKHLYHPRTVVEGSVMPAYPYLFEKRRVMGSPSPSALKLEGAYAPEPGYEVVPKHEARVLVAYLLSLRSGVSLPAAPIIPPPTNHVDQTTNGVGATVTNSVPSP